MIFTAFSAKPDETQASHPLELQSLRDLYVHDFPDKPPSSQGDPFQFLKLQRNKQHMIPCNRPPWAASSIPSTLLHPIFGEFKDDCQNYKPTAADNKLVLTLSTEMSHFFDNEAARASKFREILRDSDIDTSATVVEGTGFTTDGDIQLKGFRFVILEIKNEIGSKGAEPHAQAISYYIHSTKPSAPSRPGFRFPCILITLVGELSISIFHCHLPPMLTASSGASIDFSAAVWGTRPNMQVLSTALPLFAHQTDTEMREMAARHIGALRKALCSLKQCYDEELSRPTPLRPNLGFPYPLSYPCFNNPSLIRHFRYTSQMDNSKLLFAAAELDDNEKICIKFVRHYSKDVHAFCASEGFAPTLKGFNELPGGWYMVVMEMIGEDYCCLSDLARPYTHYEEIRQKLTSLHQANYVHGDIRDMNIMVRKDGVQGFKLVDFDWSGTIGQVRYPMNVYRGPRLWRPPEVEDGQLIKADHDIDMLKAACMIHPNHV